MQRRLHILHLLTLSDIGGAERMVLSLVKQLSPERFCAAVACLKGGGRLQEDARALGLTFYDLQDNPFKTLYRFVQLLRNQKIHLLQTHGARAELFGAVAARLAGVRVVSTLHDLFGFDRRAKVFTNRLADPFIDRYVSVTEIGRRLAKDRFGIDGRRIEVIENGIELPEPVDAGRLLDLHRSLGVGERLLVVTVANLRPVKGHLYVLRAIQLMSAKERRRLIFCFVGADQMNGDLQRAAGEMGIADQIIFAGFKSNVSVYLRAADIFLLPSENEGMPMAVLEAMAAGCPVIATDVGGVSEAVEDGRTGLLIAPRSAQAIRDALHKLSDGSLRRSLAAHAMQAVKSRFSIDRMVRQYQDLYQQLFNAACEGDHESKR